MDKYIDRDRFEYIEVDTDSAYLAHSGNSLQEVIKPKMKENFQRNLFDNCNDNFTVDVGDNDVWFARECCEKHSKYESREIGLMKIEFEAKSNC
jgi:hypothetical protein